MPESKLPKTQKSAYDEIVARGPIRFWKRHPKRTRGVTMGPCDALVRKGLLVIIPGDVGVYRSSGGPVNFTIDFDSQVVFALPDQSGEGGSNDG